MFPLIDTKFIKDTKFIRNEVISKKKLRKFICIKRLALFFFTITLPKIFFHIHNQDLRIGGGLQSNNIIFIVYPKIS